MTLVLACLTREVVYQISDRRLTGLAPPHEPRDDETNKAVVVAGRVVFGYTGLAQIETEQTDLWLTRILAGGSSDDMSLVAERLRIAATEAFRKIKCDEQSKRHAFQGVGWFRLKGETALTPGILTVDNAIDHSTGGWLPVPKDEFTTTTQFPTTLPAGCILNSVGFPLSSSEKGAIVRLIRKCVKHRRSTPRTVVSGLVIALRWLSKRYGPNSAIGAGLMVVSLPRQSVELAEQTHRILLLAGPPAEGVATFLYVSATGSATYFGPNFVGGGSAISDFRAGSL